MLIKDTFAGEKHEEKPTLTISPDPGDMQIPSQFANVLNQHDEHSSIPMVVVSGLVFSNPMYIINRFEEHARKGRCRPRVASFTVGFVGRRREEKATTELVVGSVTSTAQPKLPNLQRHRPTGKWAKACLFSYGRLAVPIIPSLPSPATLWWTRSACKATVTKAVAITKRT